MAEFAAAWPERVWTTAPEGRRGGHTADLFTGPHPPAAAILFADGSYTNHLRPSQVTNHLLLHLLLHLCLHLHRGK